MQTFDLKEIVKSKTKYKKYDAVVQNTTNRKLYIIPFGDLRFQHFFDKTPLKLYSNLNHLDLKRRDAYHKRHKFFIKDGYYSAGYFALKYLW